MKSSSPSIDHDCCNRCSRRHRLIVKETAFEVVPLQAVVETMPMPLETKSVRARNINFSPSSVDTAVATAAFPRLSGGFKNQEPGTNPVSQADHRVVYFTPCGLHGRAFGTISITVPQDRRPLPFSVTNEARGLGQRKTFLPLLTRVSRTPETQSRGSRPINVLAFSCATPRTLRAFDPPAHCADARDCTTEVHNTHKTSFREVRYRWHPWHGQRVAVRGESRRGSAVVLQCVRDEVQGCRTLEIPEWMFDATVCTPMKSSEFQHADCAALLALKHLLSAATGWSERDVVQAQHQSRSAGDADAKAIAAPTQSGRAVFSTGSNPRVTRRGATEGHPSTGQDAERILAAPLPPPETGGGR